MALLGAADRRLPNLMVLSLPPHRSTIKSSLRTVTAPDTVDRVLCLTQRGQTRQAAGTETGKKTWAAIWIGCVASDSIGRSGVEVNRPTPTFPWLLSLDCRCRTPHAKQHSPLLCAWGPGPDCPRACSVPAGSRAPSRRQCTAPYQYLPPGRPGQYCTERMGGCGMG
jgi:hypothetical protein